MAKDNGDKTPSADEIIEALAIDLGVDEKGAKKTGEGTDAGSAETSDTVEDVGGAEAAAAPTTVLTPPPLPSVKRDSSVTKKERAAQADKAKAAPPKRVPSGPAKAAPSRPAAPKLAARNSSIERAQADHFIPEHVATQEEVVEALDEEHGLDALFNISGEGADPYVGDYYDGDAGGDEPLRVGSGVGSALMKVALVLIITGALIGGTYMAIPDEYRQDVGPLLSCEDIQTQRRLRREAERERERREWLAAQPKYGTLTVNTRPGFSRVIVSGQPTYTRHPNDEHMLVETRSGTTFADLDITNPYTVTIALPNYEDQTIELLPYDQQSSLWQQRQDDGTWFLEMNELLQPDPDIAEEMRLRMTSAEAPDLLGEITVRTSPPGAQVYYNNRLLVGEDGQPLVTPVTFSSYPPPPPQPEGSGEAATPPAPQEPIPVTLRATGVPIRVELEGYMPVVTGVYRHMFTCYQREGVSLEAPFWEQCQYTYDTGVIQLVTPEEFSPPGEGSGEGTGQGAEAAGAASSG